MKKDYGKIAVTNGGIWNEQTPYEKLTTVSRGGQAYLSFEDNQGVDPEQDCDPITGIGTKWFRIATKGDPGTTDYNELINKPFIPTALSELIADALHRTVSDQEKSEWNNKANKVSNATNGNLAGLDGNGNLTDSGKKASDFATASQGAKADTALDQLAIIAALIPEQASSANQLADKAFVNSSIQTNTADFKGTRNLVSDLSLTTSATQQQIAAALASVISSADNNDYCFVQIPTDDATPTQIARIDRYKYNGSAWLFEWSLNNSSFTAAQWAAINSTVTSGDVDKLRLLPTKAQLDALLTAKQDKLVNSVNIKSINYQSLLGSGNLDISDVFIVDYGSTSLTEIEAAYSSGKVIVARAQVMRGTGYFILTQIDHENDPMGAYIFTTLVQDQLMWFSLGSINGYTSISGLGISSAIAAKYTKPSLGIPESDLTSELQQIIDNIPSILQSISAISDLVPEQASSSNQLADKNFVNSSVATNTANYISNNGEPFTSLAQLEAYSGTLTNNDYAFVVGTDAIGNTTYTRYKYNASQQQWSEEYVLNNSSFTAAQWASINSGIVDSDVAKLNALPTKTALDALFAAKQDNLVSGTNIKTINNQSVLGNGNLDVKDVFIAQYNNTSYQDVLDAYNEGKVILCRWGTYLYYLVRKEVSNIFRFAFCNGDSVKSIALDTTGWVFVSDFTFERQSNKTSNFNTIDTIKYPTTKAVADYAQPKIDSTHKLDADLVDDSSTAHKFVTSAQTETWNTVTEKAPLPFVVTCGIDPSNAPFVNSTLDGIWTAYQNGKNIRVKFAKSGGVSFEDDATLLLDGSRNCVAHTVHNGTHYIVTIYDDNGTTKLSYAETHDSDKQDVILEYLNTELVKYAKTNEYYPEMRVGSADRVLARIEDTDTYLIRETGGADNEVLNGEAPVLGFEGNAVGWNQLFQTSRDGDTTNGLTLHKIDNTSFYFSGTAENDGFFALFFQLTVGHKYYFSVPTAVDGIRIEGLNYVTAKCAVLTATQSTISWGVTFKKDKVYSDAIVYSPLILDITLLNPALAETLTGNASTKETEGKIVESYLAHNIGLKPYYPQNPGTLLPANIASVSSIKSVNLLNPTTKQARLITYSTTEGVDNQYTVKRLPDDAALSFTPDITGVAESVTIDSNGHFVIPGVGTLSVVSGGNLYSGDVSGTYVCMTLDGSKDGTPDAFEEDVAEIDFAEIYSDNNGVKTQVCPTGMKMADYAGTVRDKLILNANGKWEFVQNVGDVDLGMLSWNKFIVTSDSDSKFIFNIQTSQIDYFKKPQNVLLNARYKSVGEMYNSTYDNMADNNTISIRMDLYTYLYIRDESYSTAEDFTTAMSGVHLFYELATPITHTNLYYKTGENTYVPLEDYILATYVNNWATQSVNTYPYVDGTPVAIPPRITQEFIIDQEESLDTIKSDIIALSENKEDKSNKVTSLSSNSTDVQYPSAKCVYDAIQNLDIQPQTAIVSVASGTTTLSAAIDTYYDFAGSVDTLAITLPVMTSATTKVKNIIFNLVCGSSPAITINGGDVEGVAQDVVYFANYLIEANKAYEINALWNGTKWVIGASEIAVPTEVEEAEE